ncbi:MAG: glycosyltransferase family 2 protein [Deltaproteobacteria bacterium]|nr:glycosyltransferase family 2 protein [Deltaproteobacteria bacterium]
MPKVSVIIPCFNQGLYLDEAVDSVLAQTFQDFEILVVDDGSTDAETVKILKDYARSKTRVIHTNNQGLAAARNNGVREAQGTYILPLDADDKIGEGYLEDAVHILAQYPEIGIVYCEASYFGVQEGRWDLPEYSLDKIMNHNVIFCTALFRKADWAAVGGYNVNMVYGWEDWDFWLSLIHRGLKVYRIPKIYFYYRLREDSMVHTMDEEQRFFMRLHAYLNHQDLYRNIADIEINLKVAELYLDTGMGFNPHQIQRQVIFTDQTVIEFDLSGVQGVKQYRFDPINAPVTMHINEITLIAEDGTSRKIEDFQSNALYAKENNLIFETADPQILFSSVGIERPLKLLVRLNFVSVGYEVIQDVLNYKNNMLAGIYHSWSRCILKPLRILTKLFRG